MYNWFKLFLSNNDLMAVAKHSSSVCPEISQNQSPKSGTSLSHHDKKRAYNCHKWFSFFHCLTKIIVNIYDNKSMLQKNIPQGRKMSL